MTAVRSLLLLLATALLLSGCNMLAHQPVTLYSLDSAPAKTPENLNGVAVLVGPVTLADYLRSANIVQRQADDTLLEAPHARWANNLPEAINNQLLRQLAGQLNSQQLVLAPAAPGFNADAQVRLSISRLDSGAEQPAVLEAQWQLLDARGFQRSNRLIKLQELHNGSLAAQISAQSLLLQRLANELTLAINTQNNAEQAAPRANKPANSRPAQKKPVPDAPTIPVVEPLSDPGVFRF